MGRVGRMLNRFPAMLLRSPLHGLMSGGVLLITFRGRKSGRRYSTPANYIREGNSILITTDSPWWKNLVGGAPVSLRIRGREIEGIAEAITDPGQIQLALQAMMERFPSYGSFANIRRDHDGRPRTEDLARAIAEGRVLVRVHLTAGSA